MAHDEDSNGWKILKQFIECNLHPYGGRFAKWKDIHAVCVCLITKTEPTGDDDTDFRVSRHVIIERNEPGGLHAEEILLKRIEEKGYPDDANIKLFINYSPCNDEGHKCSTLLKELQRLFKQVTIRFSGFYRIKRPSCVICCKTNNSFPKLIELRASPFEKKDWDELVWILTKYDIQMQEIDETHNLTDLDAIRNGTWYGKWRDWEDEWMMKDYNKMREEDEDDEEEDEYDGEEDEYDGEEDEYNEEDEYIEEDKYDGEEDEYDGEEDEYDGEEDEYDREEDEYDEEEDEYDGEEDGYDGQEDEYDEEEDEYEGEEDEYDGEEDEYELQSAIPRRPHVPPPGQPPRQPPLQEERDAAEDMLTEYLYSMLL